MKILRLYGSLRVKPLQCQWVLVTGSSRPVVGGGLLAALPRRADRVQLIVPATDMTIVRTLLPAAARQAGGSVLAFAVEEHTASDQAANHVALLGLAGNESALAVLDKEGLAAWRSALLAVGIRKFEVHCEMLLLPWSPGRWSIAWDGREGFVRVGEYEAFSTDVGDHTSPPLSLRLGLERSLAKGDTPRALDLHTTGEGAVPDLHAWESALGIPITHAGTWDWRTAPIGAGTGLPTEPAPWLGLAALLSRLRLAAWVVGIAAAFHGIAVTADWIRLGNEQGGLRKEMNSRFRATFPESVAVVDPVLQMRRKLAEIRHAAGKPDPGDFLPMLDKVAAELKGLPAGSIRVISYESGRMTIEAMALDEASLRRIQERLRQLALVAEGSASASGGRTILTVRAP